jgi:hypothetical protein
MILSARNTSTPNSLCFVSLLFLSLAGCHGNRPRIVNDKRASSSLVAPAPPVGPSLCTLTGEAKKIDQGLQTQSPVPAAIVLSGKAYTIAWARTEAVENPEDFGTEDDTENDAPAVIPEMGTMQIAKLSAGATKASGVKRLTGERTGPKELEFSSVGSSVAYFFQDEIGVHLLRRSLAGKPLPGSFQVKDAYGPSLAFTSKFGGLWLSWISACGLGGELKLYQLPAKDTNPSEAIALRADNILCDKAGTAMASANGKLALSWIVESPSPKKGRPTPNKIAFLYGDGEKGTFDEPIFISPDNSPVGGPSISFSPDGKEAAIAWLVEGGAVGFTVVSSDGAVLVSPRLVPGSEGAQDLAANLLSDPLYYGISWSAKDSVWFGLLDRSGNMPTAPLLVGKGSRPNIIKGFTNKEYSLVYWRTEADSLISSKALMFQQASCFATPKKTAKKPTTPAKE